MKKRMLKILSTLLLFVLTVGSVCPVVYADAAAVQDVTEQLEAIDTLQQMQNKRSLYTVKNSHYDTTTTNASIAEEHNTARSGYETYVSEMFAKRVAAKNAYNALSSEEKAQIDPALAAKLDEELSTVFTTKTYAVTPRNDAYTFEAVKDFGLGYEVSNHMVAGNIPQTFILVDTSDGKTEWTPNGRYVYGESNYNVTYCCDVETPLAYSSDYKRINLEDSGYYGAIASQHIRAILQNSYPYVSLDEMKANLKAGGLKADFVDSLTRADVIAATQLAVWAYANSNCFAEEAPAYFATVDVTKNQGKYFTAIHDYTNECWDWLPGSRQRTYDARAEYRVNNLAYYLCNLEGISPADDQVVISDVEVTRAELMPGTDDTYRVGMYVYLNNGGTASDNIKMTVTSYHTNEDGSTSITAQSNQTVEGRDKIEMSIKVKAKDTIKVVVEGTQTIAKGVYFYEPEGGRDVSQCLVGVAEGKTNVKAEEEFVFAENVDSQGLRIYKTAQGTGLPLSDIVFTIYNVNPTEGETLNTTPTAEEVEKYAVEANKVDSVTTDATGYASIALENGTYLVVEEANEKVVAPVNPFYISIPMNVEEGTGDGTTSVKTVSIVSVYPKNEPVIPPEVPPVIPPPGTVTGSFEILKYDSTDENKVLEGAKFELYRPATPEDTNAETILCEGKQYAAVPVKVDDKKVVLETDANGKAFSPELACGMYFLVETTAPAGYNLLDEAVSVMVASNEMTSTTVVKIANDAGSMLPETGGSGTKLLVGLGSFLTIIAIVLLVCRERMAE